MDMKALEQALATVHRWAALSEVVLVAGITGQYLAPCLKKIRVVRGVKIACAIAVVAGLLGNYEVGKHQSRDLQLFERTVETEFSGAQRETAAAKITASDSLLRVREAEKLAAQSQQRAIDAVRFGEIEHHARLQFEAANRARRITPESRNRSAKELRYFYGQPSLIIFRSGDMEASDVSVDIDQMLRLSQWNVQGRQETPMIVSVTGAPLEVNQRYGVRVQCTRDPKSQMAGRALVKQLMDAGIDAHFLADPVADLGTPMVYVTVEHRPSKGSDALAVRLERNKTTARE